jgi:WD40 repeat protein
MATVSRGRVRLWDVDAVEAIGKPIRGDAVAFAPDGRVMVTGGRDGMIRFRHPTSGKQVRDALVAGTSALTLLTFSPDGSLVASAGSDRAVRVRDAVTGDRVGRPITLPTGFVESVVFGPHGELLATVSGDGSRRRVQVWDVATGRPLTPPLPGDEATFASDGDLLATMTSRRVHVWEARTGRGKLTLPAHQAAFNPDGSLLAAAMNHGGALWLVDPATGNVVRKPLTGLTARVYAISFSPGSGTLLVTAGGSGSLQTWDVARGTGCPDSERAHGRRTVGGVRPRRSPARLGWW